MTSKRSPLTASKPSLLPTPRRPSFSSPGPSSPTNATPGPSGFRALRSLLPFGPNKNPASPNPTTSRFASFSVVRRSTQRDRSFSASQSAADLPVMVIDQTSAVEGIPLRKSISLLETPLPTVQFSEDSKASSPQRISQPVDESPVVPLISRTPSPNPELSIIIEADTSGISKHLPSASPSPTSPSPPSLPQLSLSADDTSALDLSTSQLDAQVKDAIMAQSAAAKQWLDIGTEPSLEPADASFNLGALDPELAALLSPNRIVASDAMRTKPPPPSSTGLKPQHQSSRPRLRPIQRPATAPTDATATRRSPSVSPSTTHFTAVAPPSPHSPSPLTQSSPVTSSTPAVRRTQHAPSASTSTPHLTNRRPMLGRMLQADNWDGTPRPSIDTMRRGHTTGDSDVRSSENTAAWSLKLRRPRKRSLSVDEHTSPTTSRDVSPQPHTSRPGSSMANRTEWLGPRTAKAFRAAGLLGPADDAESTDGLSPSEAGRSSRFRFDSVRAPSSMGRPDSRTATSPGFGMSSSGRRRGSGSGSYFGSAGSQLMESPTLTLSSRDTPRSASTAPTSISGASWERDRDEIRDLKDKHATETGALLSALSDSQRTTKVLREENVELRQRLARFEADGERITQMERENIALREFVSELREEAGQLKLQLRIAAPPMASTSRYVPAAQPLRLAGDELDRDYLHSHAPARTKPKRRLSSSSSNFAVPPSNMSLLLNEDGQHSSDFDDRSGSVMAPGSPTMVFGRAESSPTHAHHRANNSVTSMATTESIGSPRSLLLRSCDEHHLEDLEHDSWHSGLDD
ncbi:hypothetical protein C8F01DRAFT_1109958 [Mycena amicta]|nr:hypothetical protein C8F01DRAFT_1109958 [Mycena amicta]